jgi:hypothetical protein
MFKKVTGIIWETDGEKINLPTETIIECDDDDEVVDTLSDIYGFLVESVEEIREVELTNYEVETEYKSGVKRTEVIAAENETEMWKFYDAHHNKDKIESSAIVDANPL